MSPVSDSLSLEKSIELTLQIEGRNFSILTWNLTSLNTIDAIYFFFLYIYINLLFEHICYETPCE